jgi:cytochrome d ubiquinol oxidase subunit II
MPLELITAAVILVALTFYVLLGGADYGAGVLSLLARGPHAQAQRKLISEAIGPIWEANHVWLILVVTVLFTGFPPAFAIITTWLHIPLTLMLIGIVLRGAGFAFRRYDVRKHEMHPYWERTFAVASLITPVLLGITIGAIASGRLGKSDGGFMAIFVWPWLAPFPVAVGFLALVLFAFLAAVYLAREAEAKDLQEDFRQRALVAAVMVAILAVTVFVLSASGAPQIRYALSESSWRWPLFVGTATVAVGAILALWFRHYAVARVCAASEATLILWGWAVAQFPFLVVPDVTIANAAASDATLQLLMLVIVLGAVVLFPSLYYLFRIFKDQSLFAPEAKPTREG